MYISRTIHPPLLPEEKPIPTHPLHRELSLILKEIKVITDKIKDDDEAGNVENDWKFAAMVIDRLCLIGKRFNSFIFNNIIQKKYSFCFQPTHSLRSWPQLPSFTPLLMSLWRNFIS